MPTRNLLPGDVLTKIVRKTPDEVYESLKDRQLLSETGLTDRAHVLQQIEQLLLAMDQSMNQRNDHRPPSAYSLAEESFARSGYLRIDTIACAAATLPGWRRAPEKLLESELPPGIRLVSWFSPHVAHARTHFTSDADGTVVDILVKKTPPGQDHEIRLLKYLGERWCTEKGHSRRPPFPAAVESIGPDLFCEEFIYSTPLPAGASKDAPAHRFNRIEPLFQALHWIHRQGVIHGDITPNNILSTANSVRLIDFGSGFCPGIQDHPICAVTPGFHAPETTRLPANVGMDVFSLGVTLFDVLFGHRPYDTRFRSLPAASGIDHGIGQVLQRATALDPAQRQGDVLTLWSELRQALQLGPLPEALSA